MSKRFGRNQRRKLQERYSIAVEATKNATSLLAAVTEEAKRLTKQLHDTQRALIAELGSVFRVATGEELWMIPEENVRGFRDTSDHKRADKMYEVERTADVDLIAFEMTESLADAMDGRWRHRELVSFRGIRWVIDGLESYPRSINGHIQAVYGHQFTVKLRAVARSRSDG